MEAIKISVDVNVNLSESTKKFIESFLKQGVSTCSCKSSEQKLEMAPQPKPQPQPQPKAETAQPASAPQPKPAPQAAPAPKPAPSQPASQQAPASKSIDEVRQLLAQKVTEHRDSIKAKLNELGAPSVTKLDPAKYDEMYNYLASL